MCVAIAVLAASACSHSTPTAAFKAFFEASKKKDVAGIKKGLSKGTVEMLDKLAKEQNKSTDDMLKEAYQNDKGETFPETRNEKISGDTATLEVKNDKNGKWETLPFVKEDGDWKIALDKFLQDMIKSMGDKPPAVK